MRALFGARLSANNALGYLTRWCSAREVRSYLATGLSSRATMVLTVQIRSPPLPLSSKPQAVSERPFVTLATS